MYLLKGIMWFMVSMPIIVLFFQEHGLSLSKVMILQSVYSISVALFEIPSGYIADIFGRKKAIIISTILSFIGYVLFSFFSDFTVFIIAEILIGVGGSLMSGSDSAIIYDTLIENNNKKKYTKVEGKNYAIGNFSEAIAGILGGILAASSIYYPVYIQTIILSFSIPIAFSIIEPKINNTNTKKKDLKIRNILKNTLFYDKKLKWLIIFSATMGVATLSIAWFCQPFFKSINIPIVYFGLIWAILNLSVGITSYNSYRIEKNMSPIKIMTIISILMPICFFFISVVNSIFSLLFILLIYLIRGIVTPLLRNYINIEISSEKRATVLSIRSFFIRIAFASTAPLFAYFAENTSINYVFYLLSIIITFFAFLSVYKLSRLY